MRNLLAANFLRLRKNKCFWGCFFFVVAMSAMFPVMHYITIRKDGYAIPLENSFFFIAVFLGILASLFCSLFVGTEYSDGTIRNKLIVGKPRRAVYLATLVTCCVVCLILAAMSCLVYFCVGVPLLGFFQVPLPSLLAFLLILLALSLVNAAIFTLLAMLNRNKAVSVAICILLAFLMLFFASYINAQLSQEEYYTGYFLDTETGEMTTAAQPNPNYVSGTKREVYEFLLDFLPGGQAIQCVSLSAAHPWRLPAYSAFLFVVTTGAGLLLFRRKDLN